ncbi:MAG: SDR family oxidoreductase [Desulfatitalea sp.]|nr:SDR family oxidoreductase [Desulfatitalea sp.]NNK02695.1 SDR family oxidoreductase [Desulfatitalea sp.]
MAVTFRKAMVTGGAGFIGSHLVEKLVLEGCTVAVLDNLTGGHLINLDSVMEDITFVQGDIEDEQVLADHIRGCDVVFHQAAIVSVAKTVDQPVFSTQVNDLGTIKVLEAARRNGVRRVVLASSSAVYGDTSQLPKIESMVPAPLSPYAIQKLTNEYYAQLYYRLYGLETVCLRYFNVYGPRQDPSSTYSGVISIFMTRAINGEQPVIYGDGRQTRDFVYVRDVVQANLLAADHDAAPGRIFNVGNSQSVEINMLWRMIADAAGCDRKPAYQDKRDGDIVHSLASIQRAKDLLAFQPMVNMQAGIRETLAWYRKSIRAE